MYHRIARHPSPPWYHGALSQRTVLLLAIGLSACAGKTLDPWPGRSTVNPGGTEPSVVVPKAPPERWHGYDLLATLASASDKPTPSNNHEPFRWNMQVRITSDALHSYLNWRAGSSLPEGTWVVADHVARRGGAAGPYYFAHKTAKGWQFGASSRDGWLLPATEACVLCHREAPADQTFGPDPVPRMTPEVQRPDGG